MKGTFEFKLRNGSTCTIEAEYECVMKNEVIDADGIKITGKPKPTVVGRCDLVAYIDGKNFDRCWNPAAWHLIVIKDKENPGAKKISGLKVGFANPEDAERYEKWITEIIEDGKSDEVKEYEKALKDKEIAEKVESARRIIKKAESQKDIPSAKEAMRRMKQYNDIANEGGEGYVPHIVSMEEYEGAKEIIAKYDN